MLEILNVPPGRYTLGIVGIAKMNGVSLGTRWIRKVPAAFTVTNGDLTAAGVVPFNGDINHDNTIDYFDYSQLNQHYNQIAPNPGYEDDSDLNFDGVNDIGDLNILIANYNKIGARLAGGLKATTTRNSATLSWSAPDDVTAFVLYRSTHPAPPLGETDYLNPVRVYGRTYTVSLPEGSTTYFRIRAAASNAVAPQDISAVGSSSNLLTTTLFADNDAPAPCRPVHLASGRICAGVRPARQCGGTGRTLQWQRSLRLCPHAGGLGCLWTAGV